MDWLNKESRILFLKYAVPCATTLMQRKKISKKSFDSLLFALKNNTEPKTGIENKFKIAFAFCKALAKKKGIDEKAIRKYFWFKHDAVVDERFELMKDFDAIECKTYPGIVKKAGEKTVVKTSIGEQKYLVDFAPTIKAGESVIVHRNFVIEKISEKMGLDVAKKTNKTYT